MAYISTISDASVYSSLCTEPMAVVPLHELHAQRSFQPSFDSFDDLS
jgi:hypothetical protein